MSEVCTKLTVTKVTPPPKWEELLPWIVGGVAAAGVAGGLAYAYVEATKAKVSLAEYLARKVEELVKGGGRRV